MTFRSALAGSGFLALAVTVATAASAGARTTLATNKAPCVPKAVTVKGNAGQQFCGPGTATVKVGSHSYSFKLGFCAQDAPDGLLLQLSLGTDVPSFTGKPNLGLPLFELTIGKTGKQGSVLELDLGGRKLIPEPVLVAVSYHGSAPLKGTFHGKGVSGVWNCHGPIYNDHQG